eukprot:11345049-Prorocentrum_lima.AAC.1
MGPHRGRLGLCGYESRHYYAVPSIAHASSPTAPMCASTYSWRTLAACYHVTVREPWQASDSRSPKPAVS